MRLRLFVCQVEFRPLLVNGNVRRETGMYMNVQQDPIVKKHAASNLSISLRACISVVSMDPKSHGKLSHTYEQRTKLIVFAKWHCRYMNIDYWGRLKGRFIFAPLFFATKHCGESISLPRKWKEHNWLY